MKKLALFLACLFVSTLSAIDTVEPDGDKLIIHCDGPCRDQEVFYVNFPPYVVSPPNNLAYSHAAITKEFIWLAGVTGQDLNGDPVPLGPDGITQITQAYQNLVNELNYLGISVDDVVKLDVLIETVTRDDFLTYRSTANVVQSNIWDVQPPRTISGTNYLNLGVLEVSAVVKNTKKLVVRGPHDHDHSCHHHHHD